jgi:hypothetical protein
VSIPCDACARLPVPRSVAAAYLVAGDILATGGVRGQGFAIEDQAMIAVCMPHSPDLVQCGTCGGGYLPILKVAGPWQGKAVLACMQCEVVIGRVGDLKAPEDPRDKVRVEVVIKGIGPSPTGPRPREWRFLWMRTDRPFEAGDAIGLKAALGRMEGNPASAFARDFALSGWELSSEIDLAE